MRVAFLYNDSREDPAGNAEDDVPQGSPAVAALRRLGHDVVPIACSLDLAAVKRELHRIRPQVVFNRVESLGGSDAMQPAITMLLDVLELPYTGCPSSAMVLAADKVAVKEQLVRAGLPTPEWVTEDCGLGIADCVSGKSGSASLPAASKYILKSMYEHGSFEIDDSSIIGPATREEIAAIVGRCSAEMGRPFFAERFVEGREFNLSMLDGLVLPPAEIDFSAFPQDKPRIVGRDAKWDASAFEFQNTGRRFDFLAEDALLLSRLGELAISCWQLLNLRGYARVDFRGDSAGSPWILEVNTNPCLSPTSGFAAALAQAGIGYDGGIQRILEAAVAGARSPRRSRRKFATSV